MPRKVLAFLLLLFYLPSYCQIKNGNDWISNPQNTLKISILEKGIYRIESKDLEPFGYNLNTLEIDKLQLFHHGKEVPFQHNGSYIEFYAEGNNGEQDSLLYRPTSARMNPYHSLYANETYYYLTIGKQRKSLKISTDTNFAGLTPETFHIEQQIQAFNEQYSFNNSIGFPPFLMQSYYEVGEGWSGKVIIADSLAKFTIKLENHIPQPNFKPILEALFNGRTEIDHDVNINIVNNQNQNRSIGRINYFGFTPLKIKTEIEPNEISNDNKILITSQSVRKEKFEWHSITYHKISYPQSWDMTNKIQKTFYLSANSPQKSFISIPNAPQNALVYQVKNRYEFSKITSEVRNQNLVFTTTSKDAIFVSGKILKPVSIEKVNFLTKLDKDANFLIITHPTLQKSAEAYASYRSSKQGGSYKVQVVLMNEIQETYGYGERTPLSIRRLIENYFNNDVKLEYLLLIGKGYSFPDFLKTESANDFIPTMGYPGSDNLLTAGLNGFDEDVSAVPTGRLNISSNQEVENYLQKVKEYEANTDDLLWKKNVLHLNGGLSKGENAYFRGMLSNITPKVSDSFLNGKTVAISKKTEANVENIDISAEINDGFGMVTFIGHSSSTTTDLNVGYVSGLNSKFSNKLKYPLMYFNGCGVGNVFNKYNLITTDWLLTPNKGAIAVLANSFWSYDFPTSRYLSKLYTKLFSDTESAGLSIGKIQQLVNKELKHEGADPFMLSNIHQLVLQGDPSVVIFPLKKPDFSPKKLFIQSKNQSLPISQNDSVRVGVVMINSGRFEKGKNVEISIKTEGKLLQKVINTNLNNQDTLYFTIKKDLQIKKLDCEVDADNKIEENSETNNSLSVNTDWSAMGNYAVFPKDILPDKLNPILSVKFDGRAIKNEEYVSDRALVSIELVDENSLDESDTTAIQAFLARCLTCSYQKIAFKYTKQKGKTPLNLTQEFRLENLSEGTYKLLVIGKDRNGNFAGNNYEIAFNIVKKGLPSECVVYPNPSRDYVGFRINYYKETTDVFSNIEIYDTGGKRIENINFKALAGQNEVYWLPKETVSAGVYYYRVVIRTEGTLSEFFDGKIVLER